MESNVFEELIVVKRSGQRVVFDSTKIAIAIKSAFDSVYDNYDEKNVNKVLVSVLEYISNFYQGRKTINVEDIQDIIENILKETGFNDVHTSFNNYRLKRKASRELFDRKQQHKFVKATEKLVLAAKDDKFSSPASLLFNFGKTISNEFSKAYLLDSKSVRNHEEGNIYIHDLDYYVLGTTSSTHLDFTNITNYENYFENIIEILLGFKQEQYGEQSITSIDYLFVPWLLYKFKNIFKKNLCYSLELIGFNNYVNCNGINNIIDKISTIYINIDIFDKYIFNDRVRLIFESAYHTSFNELIDALNMNIEKLLLALDNSTFKINDNSKYSISLGSNNSSEGKLIITNYLEVLKNTKYLNNVVTVFKISKQSEYLDLISELILLNKNIVLSGLTHKNKLENDYKKEIEYFSNGERIYENIFDKNECSLGRVILANISINLVRIALKSKNIKTFYEYLEDILELSKNELLQTFDYITNRYKDDFKYIFHNNLILDSEKLEDNQRIRKVLKNGTLNIGYVGLYEAVYILLNKTDLKITDIDIKLATDIIKFMKNVCDKYTNTLKLNFTLSETLNNDIQTEFIKIDKSIYGIIPNITDKDSYKLFSEALDNVNIILTDRLKYDEKISKYLTGGFIEIINLPKNTSHKKVLETINAIIDFDVGCTKIRIGKRE